MYKLFTYIPLPTFQITDIKEEDKSITLNWRYIGNDSTNSYKIIKDGIEMKQDDINLT